MAIADDRRFHRQLVQHRVETQRVFQNDTVGGRRRQL
jgi:hypothetical protein